MRAIIEYEENNAASASATATATAAAAAAAEDDIAMEADPTAAFAFASAPAAAAAAAIPSDTTSKHISSHLHPQLKELTVAQTHITNQMADNQAKLAKLRAEEAEFHSSCVEENSKKPLVIGECDGALPRRQCIFYLLHYVVCLCVCCVSVCLSAQSGWGRCVACCGPPLRKNSS